MVIGYILNWFPQLSETFVENEIRTVRELGHRVVVCSLYRPGPDVVGPTSLPPACISYRPSRWLVTLALLPWLFRRPGVFAAEAARALRLRSMTQLRGVWSAGWMARCLRGEGAEHVHAHFGHDSAAAAMVAAKLISVPYTLTVHAHELYVRTNGVRERCLAADRVITVCDYNVEQLRTLCPELNPEHVAVVYCGVDPEQFHPRDPLAPNDPPRILSVGRLVAIKGFDLLIRAVAELAGQGVTVDCRIAGQGPLQSDLERLAEALGVGDRVHLVGPVTPDEVATLLSDADVFVLACRVDDRGVRDSMPVVIKEAMATEVPVVATREVAVPEMVDSAVGRLAAPEDPGDLAACIKQVLELPEASRRQLGRQGRQRVEQRFNLRSETQRLLQIFAEVAAERQGEDGYRRAGPAAVRAKPVAAEVYTEEYYLTGCAGGPDFETSAGTAVSPVLLDVMDRLRVGPGAVCLDLGCGRGEVTLNAAQRGASALGVDYADAALALARRTLGNHAELDGRVLLSKADAKNLPLPDGVVDVAFVLDLVEHLQSWELRRALEELRRVLRSDGVVFVHTMPNLRYYRWVYPLLWRIGRLQNTDLPRQPRSAYEVRMHVNEQTPRTLRKALRHAGFVPQLEVTGVEKSPVKGWLDRCLRAASHRPPFRSLVGFHILATARPVQPGQPAAEPIPASR